ncbi:aspartate kinase [Candidatus Roizmanbacteria bacterium CG22_combo_CG10-13_8_21_14_all_38_20]|uniref:Aspartate kinase n=1 Tax=Candidatus Roizmanbacteria bacterium CG22_combo_CG10-13_8_21_14_all_38_20 TaxID=1974862 RepID=A0A2H0BW30_9BACT|nr:aspartate kinase [Candidatus Microgenomates bacterium]PIP61178.1 MAG: aspartate kinase [Candidatus Roizmanbacteria bacterium CG22_combo_CG10-13_8_21_14_all_38_20]PJC31168.1 MAG: aspartate kinase [Candidatus Roizmanbacteria bacterium CG_4_9_14_0_2_um_filter_38_17]
MITVPDIVRKIISRTPYLEEALSRDIINLSGLARDIRPEVEKLTMKKVELGSVIMALKRLQPKLRTSLELEMIFKTPPELILRSNLLEITIANSSLLAEKQKHLLLYASKRHAQFITITHGIFETTIIASRQTLDMIYKLYKDEKIISEIADLSSITVKFPVDIINTSGVYYTILKILAWENIDITEVVSTYSEITIILKKDYVERAFGLIKGLFD